MREYQAEIVKNRLLDFGDFSVEHVTRRLLGRANLQFHSSGHTLFVEMTKGVRYQRRVNQASPIMIETRPKMMSFRPAHCDVSGWSEGQGFVNYAVFSFHPDHFCDEWVPKNWSSSTAFIDDDLWIEIQPFLRVQKDSLDISHPLFHPYLQGRGTALFVKLAAKFGDTYSYGVAGNISERQLQKAIEFINENLSNTISLTDISDAANISKSQLIKIFREEMHTTPISFLGDRRIDAARRMLSETDMPIAVIAAEFGYSDQSHFTRRFKAATGHTPNFFRKHAPVVT